MEEITLGPGKLIIIGGSAGSLEVLFRIIPGLRSDLPHPIVIVLHRKASTDTQLIDLLSSKTSLQVKEIEDKDSLDEGSIFIAPGDYHLLFEKDGTLALDDSEKVAFSRPSIDVAFQSAAEAYGERLISILLSGANADGSAGMETVKATGGVTIVQSPDSAEVAYMPQQAIDRQVADLVLDVQGILDFLNAC